MKRILDWLRSLFNRAKPEPVPAPVAVPTVLKPEEFEAKPAKLLHDYEMYASMTPMEIQLIAWRGQGTPKGWDWNLWSLASGKPHPFEHDNRWRKIEPLPAFSDPESLTGSGEFDLLPGETKIIHCPTPSFASWVFHAPITRVPGRIKIGGSVHGAGSGPVTADIDPGTHQVTLLEGPSQGIRFALQPK